MKKIIELLFRCVLTIVCVFMLIALIITCLTTNNLNLLPYIAMYLVYSIISIRLLYEFIDENISFKLENFRNDPTYKYNENYSWTKEKREKEIYKDLIENN